MASVSQQMALPFNVLEVEALSARRALEFAHEGLNWVVLKGDSKVLIKPLQSSISSLAQRGHIIEDVKSTLPLFFFTLI